MIRIKRIYDSPRPEDGKRLLVDRLWPRGIKKESAQVDEWLKDLAPSNELRAWFGHDPAKWEEFRRRYYDELTPKHVQLAELKAESERETVTLVYGAKDTEHNNAVVLKEIIGNA